MATAGRKGLVGLIKQGNQIKTNCWKQSLNEFSIIFQDGMKFPKLWDHQHLLLRALQWQRLESGTITVMMEIIDDTKEHMLYIVTPTPEQLQCEKIKYSETSSQRK